MLRAPVIRQLRAVPRTLSAIRPASTAAPAPTSSPSGHPLSNPTLANIEKRWETMPPQEQADLWMALRDRMRLSWHELTLQEKKAGTFTQITACVYSGNKTFFGFNSGGALKLIS